MARDQFQRFGSFAQHLERLAGDRPEQLALRFLGDGVSVTETRTYAELINRIARLARTVSARAAPGAVAVLAFRPGIPFIETFLACLWAGVVPVAVPTGTGRRAAARLAAVAADAAPALYLSGGAAMGGTGIDWQGLGPQPEDPQPLSARNDEPDEMAFVQYTAGTTGRPRGAVISHAALMAEMAAYAARHGGDRDDLSFVSWLPHTHDFGLVGMILAALYQGAPLTFMPPEVFVAEPLRWLEAISRYRAVATGAPAFAYDLAARAGAGAGDALDLSSLRYAALGGDYIQPETLARFERVFGPSGFAPGAWLPAYGQAEAVLAITTRQGARIVGFDAAALRRGIARPAKGGGVVRLVSCGAPDDGNRLLIRDPESGAVCPEGRLGEICVEGPVRASTILGETADGPLRTGDLGFVLTGELFVTGRIADRIVVNGENYGADLLEAAAAAAMPEVALNAVAAVQTDFADGAEVVLIVAHSGLRSRDCAAMAAAVMAEHGIAVHRVIGLRSGALPKALGGKVARQACLTRLAAGDFRPLVEWRPPTAERTVAEEAGAPDVQLAILEELRQIRVLLERQGAQLAAGRAGPSGPVAVPTPDAPLSPMQAGIMTRQMLLPAGDDQLVVQMVLECTAPVTAARVHAALGALATRHEALRTVISGQRQVALAHPTVALDKVVLPDEAAIAGWLRAARQKGFEVETPPLWRATLLEAGAAQFLVVTASRLIADGVSMRLIAEGLAAQLAGEDLPVAAPQMRAVQARQAQALKDEARATHRAYWQGVLGRDAPDWQAPGQKSNLRLGSYRCGRQGLTLPAEMRQRLIAAGGACGATLAQVLASFQLLLLRRVSRQDRLMIGMDCAGRDGPGAAGTIGCLNQLVPLVFDFEAEAPASLAELIAKAAAAQNAALAHQHYGLDALAEDTGRIRDPARPFAFMAGFSFQSMTGDLPGLATRLDLARAAVACAPFGLAFEWADRGDVLELDLVHNRDILDAGWVAALEQRFVRLLSDGMAAHPDDLPLVTPAEWQALRTRGRGAEAQDGAPGLWAAVREQAARRPDAPAIADEHETLSYGDLVAAAGAVAQWLRRQGVAPGDRVALLARRGCRYWAAVLGMFVDGVVHVPLDPAAPVAQSRAQAAGAGIGWLLHDGPGAALAAEVSGPEGWQIATLDDAIAETASGLPDEGAGAEAMAHVLFPSDSVGAPAVVQVSHGGMMNHLRAKVGLLAMGPQDRVAQSAPQGGDIAVWQAFAPLLAGGQVRVVDDRTAQDAAALFALAGAARLTVLQVAPAVLQSALEHFRAARSWPELPALRYLIVTGEALGAAACRTWISHFPKVPLVNAHGVPECSGDVAHFVAEWPPEEDAFAVPVGGPIPGAELLVLGPRAQPVPAGTPGELYVGGACVAPGYPGKPVRRGTAFVTHPEAGRLFRSGDLVRWQDAGLEYLGRADRQQRRGGMRFEPGEVEAAIATDPAVDRAVVRLVDREGGRQQLVAWVQLRAGRQAIAGTIKAVARNHLPRTLVPDVIVFVARMPLTRHGRTDLAALPDPGPAAPMPVSAPPESALERSIARVWEDVLGQKDIGLHDDFFELGGRSLDATRIARQLEDDMPVKVPLTQIFRNPTVAGLAAYLARTEAGGQQ